MVYSRTTWVNGTTPAINATNLNNIENGIVAAMGSVFNVKDYGAVGNGATNDSAAIRSAISAASSGDTVYFPTGTYIVAQDGASAYCLSVPAGVRIAGSGVVRMANSTAVSVSVFYPAGAGVQFEGISIDGNKDNNTTNEHRHGIQVAADDLIVNGVTIYDCTGDGIEFVSGSSGARVMNSHITGCERNGITFYSTATPCENHLITNCYITAAVQAIDSEPETAGIVKDIRVIGNYLAGGPSVVSTDGWAISMSGTSSTYPTTGWTVLGNTMLGGMYVINAEDCTVSGNHIDGTGYNVVDAVIKAWFNNKRIVFSDNVIIGDKDLLSLARSGNYPTDWMITGNEFYCASGNPITLSGCGPVTVANNLIFGDNTAGDSHSGIYVFGTGAMDVTITGNLIRDCGVGVYVAPYSTNNIDSLTITDNMITNTQGTPVATYGIQLAGTASQYLSTVVSGNNVGAEYTTDVSLGSVRTMLAGSSGGIAVYTGNGAPTFSAPAGSLYLRNDGTTNLYVNQSGSTTWTSK